VLLLALTLVARRRSLLAPGQTSGGSVRRFVSAAVAPAVFFISTLYAGKPYLAMQLWWLIIPGQVVTGVIGRRLEAWIDRPRAVVA
jgi:hypothetical protein